MKIYPTEKEFEICINCEPSCPKQCIDCPLLGDCLFIYTGDEDFLKEDEENIITKENKKWLQKN